MHRSRKISFRAGPYRLPELMLTYNSGIIRCSMRKSLFSSEIFIQDRTFDWVLCVGRFFMCRCFRIAVCHPLLLFATSKRGWTIIRSGRRSTWDSRGGERERGEKERERESRGFEIYIPCLLERSLPYVCILAASFLHPPGHRSLR